MKKFCLILLLLTHGAFASPDLVDEQGPVTGMMGITNHITERTKIKVLIPNDFSMVKGKFAGYLVNVDKNSYSVSVDANNDCRSAHYCQIGSFQAISHENPVIHHDMNNQEMTEALQLNGNIKAYYTQGYALGSFTPSQIEWRCGHVLYRITWNQADTDIKKLLIALANNAVMNSKCQ